MYDREEPQVSDTVTNTAPVDPELLERLREIQGAAFQRGYERGAEAAEQGEILAENAALWMVAERARAYLDETEGHAVTFREGTARTELATMLDELPGLDDELRRQSTR